tara:strand:- start:1044 stop:1514 length:471 start_codon:yes stop_codon:yes gene_type:complete
MTIKKLLYRLETIRDSLADRDGMDEYAIEGTMDDISLLMNDIDSFGVEDDIPTPDIDEDVSAEHYMRRRVMENIDGVEHVKWVDTDNKDSRMDVIGQNGNTGLHYDKLEKDNCVSCNKESEYNKNDNIYNRRYYVEGAGQLCGKCWSSIYDTNKTT